ncbi:MAG TPA: D-alanyl-D-alanine carboxypeptidase family protein [Methylomirabilota bacterium]|nr:D-alanyl-D-alanine carboxypeptidase family protein [Methylomirabilota bacterium]
MGGLIPRSALGSGEVRRRALGAALVVAAFAAVLLLAPPAGAAPPAVTAEAGLLLDLGTGEVLYAKNAESDRAPASLVKMMTLYVAYTELRAGKARLSDPVIISPNVMRTPRFRMGLAAGQVVPFEILLAGVAIASANDAATAVAEYLAGSEELFVERMNAEAQRIGLAHTHFANPHGLPDPQQRTTAHDMALLAQRLLSDFPESRDVLGETQFTWRGRLYQRRIPLFRDPGGVTALKTGFTLEAGYNLAVAAGKAGHRVLCIILGAETRGLSFLDAGRLIRFGFGEPTREVRRDKEPRRDPRRWRLRPPRVPTARAVAR